MRIGRAVFTNCASLETVVSKIEDPSDIEPGCFTVYEYNWNEEQEAWEQTEYFTTATLYVPQGTKARYEAAEGWKEFGQIVEMDPTAIDGAAARQETAARRWYSLQGTRQDAPRKGVNIVQMEDGSVRKVLVK